MNAEEVKNRIFTALDNLAGELETSGEPLETFLKAMAKSHRYSFWNTILITMTRVGWPSYVSALAGSRFARSVGCRGRC